MQNFKYSTSYQPQSKLRGGYPYTADAEQQ